MFEKIPLINIFTAVLFVAITLVITVSLYQANSQMNRAHKRRHHKGRRHDSKGAGAGAGIDDAERVYMVSKCNSMEEELQALLANQLVNADEEHKHMLMEKKHFVKKIKNIANDLSFNNKGEFQKLYVVLKDIQKDIKDQNKRIVQLEQQLGGNELANILIQRMVNDSVLKTKKLHINNTEDDERVMEKYIIKTIREEIAREMHKYPTHSQTMNPTSANELERKMELMDLINHKLQSMENLYRNLHSNNKHQIITTIREPVQKSVQSYMWPPQAKKSKTNPNRNPNPNANPNMAATFYVV